MGVYSHTRRTGGIEAHCRYGGMESFRPEAWRQTGCAGGIEGLCIEVWRHTVWGHTVTLETGGIEADCPVWGHRGTLCGGREADSECRGIESH
jgi:hypothetical protein